MRRLFRDLWPALLLIFLAKSMSAQTSIVVATASIPSPRIDTSEVSADLMAAAHAKFLEGYALIQAGRIDEARSAFDAALDMLAAPGRDIAPNTPLNTFYWELVEQIKDAGAAYLYMPEDMGDRQDGLDGEVDEEEDDGEEFVGILSDEEFQELGLEIRDDPVLKQALSDAYWTEFDFPISVNDTVASSLDYLLTRGHKFFADGLVRSGQYRPMIEQVFREAGLPLDLISLAHVESAFKPQALSRAKARGIWQFCRETAIRYGLKVTKDIDERSDPEKSTRAAVRYLKDLYAMFGDWNLVLAAYNWGEGNIQRLIDNTGQKDFWQLSESRKKQAKLPDETRRHVPMIQASAILTRNPERYGFPTEFEPQVRYATIVIARPVDLRAVAKVLSISFDELRQLNPALRGSRTPANYPGFELKVPADSDPDLYELVAKLPVARARDTIAIDRQHRVKRGDTLYALARQYGVTVNDLRKANGLSDKAILKIGMVLDIPESGGPVKTASAKKR